MTSAGDAVDGSEVGSEVGSAPVVVVVGNPRTSSRTAAVAVAVGDRVASLLDVAPGAHVHVLELGPWATALVAEDDPSIEALRQRVLGATALVVASPTYKATFSGLLKLFLERFGSGELAATPTVAVMTGGSPAHSLAVPLHLAPVLVHLGASLPTAGVHLSGAEVDDPSAAVDEWFAAWRPALRRALA